MRPKNIKWSFAELGKEWQVQRPWGSRIGVFENRAGRLWRALSFMTHKQPPFQVRNNYGLFPSQMVESHVLEYTVLDRKTGLQLTPKNHLT